MVGRGTTTSRKKCTASRRVKISTYIFSFFSPYLIYAFTWCGAPEGTFTLRSGIKMEKMKQVWVNGRLFSRQRRTWECTQRFRPRDGAYSRTTWLSDTCPLKGGWVRFAVIISSSWALPNVSCSGCGLVSYMSVVRGTWIWTSTVPVGSGAKESYHDRSSSAPDHD